MNEYQISTLIDEQDTQYQEYLDMIEKGELIYDPDSKCNLDAMEELDMRHCELCGCWVKRYEEWDREYEACIFCAENDDQYQKYLKKQMAYESHIDSMLDHRNGK